MGNGPHFAICRIDKLKGRQQLTSRAGHHLRDGAKLPRNADAARTADNTHSWTGTSEELADAIQARTTPLKRRKDAVDALDVLLTASPSWFTEHGGRGDYMELAMHAEVFLYETFGPDNVMAWGVHLDEQTPHVWALVTPIVPGKKPRLAASNWVDGPSALSKLQDGWANATKDLGLSRGVAGQPARHTAIRDFYAGVNGDPTARASIIAEQARRATASQREALAKQARELEEKDLELKAREGKATEREAKLSEERRQLAQQQVALRRAWEAMEPAAKIVAAQRMRELEQRDKAAELARERPKAPKPR